MLCIYFLFYFVVMFKFVYFIYWVFENTFVSICCVMAVAVNGSVQPSIKQCSNVKFALRVSFMSKVCHKLRCAKGVFILFATRMCTLLLTKSKNCTLNRSWVEPTTTKFISCDLYKSMYDIALYLQNNNLMKFTCLLSGIFY